MASLSKESSKTWRIQWVDIAGTGRRKQIRMSGLTRKQAESQFARIESIISTRLQGAKLDDVDAAWLGGLSESFHNKLAKTGLVESRVVEVPEPEDGPITLRKFLDEFIEDGLTSRRAKASDGTRKNWRQTRDLLLKCFGDKLVSSFSVADGKTFRKWLEKRKIRKSVRNPTGRMMENTLRQRMANAKSFFSHALSEELVASNPFRNQASSTVESGGKVRIPSAIIDKIIDVAPTFQWKLLIALWRYAGLRKMEALELTWSDVLWEQGKLRVRSPKTEHHAGREMRYVPIRDVEVFLRDAWEQAKDGDERLISQYRVTMSNLHKPFEQIIEKAGLTPWPNLIKNLRLSCENDWIDNKEAPDHVIAAWIGHSVQVQRSDYALVSAGHFEQFNARPVSHSKNGSDSGSDDVSFDENSRETAQLAAHLNHSKNANDQCFSERNMSRSLVPTGLEPVTFRM